MASEMSLHHYGKPLVCTYSGGKDSDVMLELFKRSGIPFEVHNSHTTGVRWDESNARSARAEFEKIGKSKKEIVRFDTVMLMNDNTASRRMTELCMQKNKMVVNPIIDWTHTDVWEYIRSEHIETCELYKMGYDRVGCIGCPMAGKKRWKEFADFPKYKSLYIHAFERMLKERNKRGKESKWETGEEVFSWWMENDDIPGQMFLDEICGDEN